MSKAAKILESINKIKINEAKEPTITIKERSNGIVLVFPTGPNSKQYFDRISDLFDPNKVNINKDDGEIEEK